MDTQEILKESQRWLDIIATPELTDEQKAKIVADTVDNFSFYYNRGYLDYRKSVVEMRDSPALEWHGQGSVFCDILGEIQVHLVRVSDEPSDEGLACRLIEGMNLSRVLDRREQPLTGAELLAEQDQV